MGENPEDDQPPPLVRTPPPPEASEEDWRREDDLFDAEEQARLLRALFTNRIFIQPDGAHLRISFGEQVKGEARYHTSIVVPNADALEFGRLLTSMAEQSVAAQIEYYRQILGVPNPEGPDGQ